MGSAEDPGRWKRRQSRFVTEPGDFTVVEPEEPGLIVLVDEDAGYAITWNASRTFRVWQVTTNGFATRLLREVDVFSVTEVPDSEESAGEAARDWWLD